MWRTKWDADGDRREAGLRGDGEEGCQYDVFILRLMPWRGFGSRWPERAEGAGAWKTSHKQESIYPPRPHRHLPSSPAPAPTLPLHRLAKALTLKTPCGFTATLNSMISMPRQLVPLYSAGIPLPATLWWGIFCSARLCLLSPARQKHRSPASVLK